MNNPVLNLNKLDLLRQLDPGGGALFLKKLISIYLSSVPVSLEQIENAIQLADSSYAFKKAAHTFKSSAANMGAEKLAEICLQLEEYGENHQLNEASDLLGKLQCEFQQVTVSLEELLVTL